MMLYYDKYGQTMHQKTLAKQPSCQRICQTKEKIWTVSLHEKSITKDWWGASAELYRYSVSAKDGLARLLISDLILFSLSAV